MVSREDIVRLIDEFDALATPHPSGKIQIPFPKLVEFVRSNPDDSLAMLMGFTRAAAVDPKCFQRALIIGTAYKVITEDDSPLRFVERAIGREDVPTALPTMADVGEEERLKIIQLQVDELTMHNLDIYGHVKMFSLLHKSTSEGRESLKELAGRCIWGFAVDDDPREAWMIPEVREYLRHVHQAMPYFPYFLLPDPRMGAIVFYLLCLTPLAAFNDESKISLLDPSFLEVFTVACDDVTEFCAELGTDHAQPLEQLVFSVFGGLNQQPGNAQE